MPTNLTPSDALNASRRQFLTAAGTLAGGALAIGALSSLAQAKGRAEGDQQVVGKAKPRIVPEEGKPIRIGVIGLGGPNGCAMGLGHCLSIIALAKKKEVNAQIVAICDLNKLHLDYGKKEIDEAQGGSVETHDNYHDLLARNDIHGVVIATPEHWHAQMGIDAILAGKDVYLEKPMTLHLEDAVRLYKVQQANPELIVQIGPQMTNLPKYHEAKKLIKSGAIGTPMFSQTSYCRNSKSGEWHYKVNPEWKPGVNLNWEEWCGPLGQMEWDPKVYYQWRRYRKTSTGVLGDLLVHVMTPMLMTLDQGWPVRVTGIGSHLCDKEMENHDLVNLAVEFETGHQMIACGGTGNDTGLETMIRGHEANLFLNSAHCVLRPERIYSEERDEKTITCEDIGNDQDRHRVKWINAIRSREQPWSSVELGLKVMVVVDLATRSMWEGGAYRFDSKTMMASKA